MTARNEKNAMKALKGLAGAAALAAGSQAYGQVTPVATPADLANLGEGTANPGPGQFDPVAWDVNGDAVDDFGFNFRNIDDAVFTWQANIYALNAGNGADGYIGFFLDYANNLPAGTTIDGGLNFVDALAGNVALGSEYLGLPYGGFGSVDSTVRGFVGFRFLASGNTHYGWVEIETGEDFGLSFLGAAYNATPDAPIAAGEIPEPSTLAALAFGACALLRRR